METEDKEEALRDLARLYERMVMRRHTNGGYQNVVDELWRQCEAWNTNIIIMYQNVACKNMATVQGILDEQGRERGYHMIWIEHDLMDPRTVSRKTMRDKVNEYMRTVMRAEPIDPSLIPLLLCVTHFRRNFLLQQSQRTGKSWQWNIRSFRCSVYSFIRNRS